MERTRQSNYEEKFISRTSEHCERFSDYNANGHILSASNTSISQIELGDMARRNDVSKIHKPKKHMQLMMPATSYKRRKKHTIKRAVLAGSKFIRKERSNQCGQRILSILEARMRCLR